MNFTKGDTVISQPIGSKESFKGTVVGVGTNYKNEEFYNVRDFYGLLWQRSGSELALA